MPYIDPKIVAEVKQIDLLTYLQEACPQELVPLKHGEYCLRSHDSLKISNGKWHWFSRGIGGRSALDYLIKVEGISFMDAVLRLADGSVRAGQASPPAEKRKRNVLLLPTRYPTSDRVYGYLVNARGIDPAIASGFIRRGLVYESEYTQGSTGRRFANAVFLGLDKDGAPRQASIRGMASSYKSEASGSDKRYTFSLSHEGGSPRIHLFESAIDLMSYMSVKKAQGENPRDGHLLSLSGVYMPQTNPEKSRVPLAVTQYLKDYSGITEAVLHFDGDRTGRMMSEAMRHILPAVGLSVTDEPPPQGKDYNDYLQAIQKRAYESEIDER